MRGLVDGKYRITRALGRGGMAEVFEAEHVTLGTSFALKFAHPDVAADPELSKRFLNEARAAARIKSEFVARVTDLGTFEDRPYMVMELLTGEDLETLAARYLRLPISEAVDYMIQALAGLHEVHAVGIVHRDLKPSNLFIHRPPGKPPIVKLVDFGVSKSYFGTQSKITTTGNVLGSPAYMSPEQLRSAKHVDARADIWSCGVILYELLTGTMPFFGENVGAVFASILETEVAPPENVPAPLGEIVLRCLKKNADDRWSSALDLAIALAPFASEDGRSIAGSIAGPRSFRPSRTSVPEIRYRNPAIVDTISSVPPAASQTFAGKDSMATRSRSRVFGVAMGIALLGILGSAAAWRWRAPPQVLAPAAPSHSTAVTIEPVAPVPSANAAPSSVPVPEPVPAAASTTKRVRVTKDAGVSEDAIFGRH